MSVVAEEDVKERMNEQLKALFNEVLSLEEAWLRRHGMKDLTMTEMHMLVAIKDRENGAMSDVARQASLSNGTVTTTVKRLERKGFVVRARDANDTRKLRVRLSSTGKDAVALHDRFHDRLCDIIWQRLGAAHAGYFMEGITTIMDFLSDFDEEDA